MQKACILPRQQVACTPPVQVGWYGSKELAGYNAVADPCQRLLMARAALGHATVNPPTLHHLREAAEADALLILEGRSIAAVQRSGSQWDIRLDEKTGQSTGIQPEQATDSISSVQADVLWVAAGTAVNVLADPVFARLQASCPTHIVGGLPVLDSATLAWPGLPLFLLGRSALLSVGPAAGMHLQL